MSGMAVNGAAVLLAIAQRPTDLSFSDAQVNDIAMSILVAKLKDKELKVEHLRQIATVIGRDNLKLALDHLQAKETTSLVKRLDGKNPEIKTADEIWTLQRVTALIFEGANPTIQPPKTPKPPVRSAGSKTGKALQSKALKPRVPRKSTSKQV